MPSFFILRGHEPVVEPDSEKFFQWFATADRCVRRTRISEDVEVSTIFLGFDHNFLDGGPPVLFETMIFGGVLDDEYRVRSCTWKESLGVHRDAVQVACKTEGIPPKNVRDIPSPMQEKLIDEVIAELGPTWFERILKDDG